MSTVWMEITTDELQLPVVVAITKAELAWRCGVHPCVIDRQMREALQGKRKQKYIAVEVEDEE